MLFSTTPEGAKKMWFKIEFIYLPEQMESVEIYNNKLGKINLNNKMGAANIRLNYAQIKSADKMASKMCL